METTVLVERIPAARRLGTLIERKLITPTPPTRSSNQCYWLVDPEES